MTEILDLRIAYETKKPGARKSRVKFATGTEEIDIKVREYLAGPEILEYRLSSRKYAIRNAAIAAERSSNVEVNGIITRGPQLSPHYKEDPLKTDPMIQEAVMFVRINPEDHRKALEILAGESRTRDSQDSRAPYDGMSRMAAPLVSC